MRPLLICLALAAAAFVTGPAGAQAQDVRLLIGDSDTENHGQRVRETFERTAEAYGFTAEVEVQDVVDPMALTEAALAGGFDLVLPARTPAPRSSIADAAAKAWGSGVAFVSPHGDNSGERYEATAGVSEQGPLFIGGEDLRPGTDGTFGGNLELDVMTLQGRSAQSYAPAAGAAILAWVYLTATDASAPGAARWRSAREIMRSLAGVYESIPAPTEALDASSNELPAAAAAFAGWSTYRGAEATRTERPDGSVRIRATGGSSELKLYESARGPFPAGVAFSEVTATNQGSEPFEVSAGLYDRTAVAPGETKTFVIHHGFQAVQRDHVRYRLWAASPEASIDAVFEPIVFATRQPDLSPDYDAPRTDERGEGLVIATRAGLLGTGLGPAERKYAEQQKRRLEQVLEARRSGGLAVSARVYLEGPYTSGGAMRTALASGGYLPSRPPYDRAPWNYEGSALAGEVPPGAVDWVLVELRAGDPQRPPMTTVARRAAFLMSDGRVAGTDGSSPVAFAGASPGDYFVVVRHRNHLPVMSAEAVSLAEGTEGVDYDFTSGAGQAYGSAAMVSLGGGAYGLRAGDANRDGQVQTRDKNEVWAQQVGQSGYRLAADFNLDGQVQTQDKNNVWAAAVGAGSFVPGASAATRSTAAAALAAATPAAGPGITFSFANAELVEENGTQFFAFDVEVAAAESGTRLGDTQTYIDYNAAAFGSSIANEGRISVAKGDLIGGTISGIDKYDLINVADNAASKVSITYGYEFAGNPEQGAEVPTTPAQLMRVRIEVADDLEEAGLGFDESLMAGNQFLSDNATAYDPVAATDMQVALPVELGAFTGRADGRVAVLEWETHSETNNRGFYIEQQAGDSWETVGEMIEGAGGGTSQEARRYTRRVEGLGFGRHVFRLRQVDLDGSETVFDEKRVELQVQMDEAYTLGGAYPNPFQSRATVSFAVREAQNVTVALYNTLGQRVQVLHEGAVPGGETVAATLAAGQLSSGIYFVRLRGEDFVATESVTLVR